MSYSGRAHISGASLPDTTNNIQVVAYHRIAIYLLSFQVAVVLPLSIVSCGFLLR